MTKVMQILIFAWKFWSYHWQQIVWIAFLEITCFISFISKKMSAKCPTLNNPFIWQSLFQVKMMFHGEDGLACNSAILVFILKPLYLICKEGLHWTSHFITQSIKENIVLFHLYEMFRRGKTRNLRLWLWLPEIEGRREGKWQIMGMGFIFGLIKIFWN